MLMFVLSEDSSMRRFRFDSLAAIAAAEQADLREVGFKLGHAKLVLKAAEKLRASAADEKRNATASSSSSSSASSSSSSSASSAEQEMKLGLKFEHGDGVARDFKSAFKHYEK